MKNFLEGCACVLLSAAFVVAAPIIIEEIEFLIHYLDFQHEILSSLS